MAYRTCVLGTMTNGVPIYEITPAYQIDEADANTTYLRYEDTTAAQFIKKIIKASTVTSELKVIGLWVDRATLTYKGINTP